MAWTIGGNPATHQDVQDVVAASRPIRPEDYGAAADGVTDDGPAWTSAIAAAAAIAAGRAGGARVRGTAGKTYRIATSITMGSDVIVDLNGARLLGPITSYAPISSTNNPSVPSGTDKAGQTAGGCFTDTGTGTLDAPTFTNGVMEGFRYGMVSRGFAWAHPEFRGIVFVNCNIGFFAYQGCQNPVLINTYSHGASAGTTLVANATCFPTGHVDAGADNFFCDNLVYDNTGSERDQNVKNDTFDTWFEAAILRPTTGSVVISGTRTFDFSTAGAGTSWNKVSGRAIYIPSRNQRLTFMPHIREGELVYSDRGMALIGNPVSGDFENVSGELLYGAGADSMFTILLSNGYASSATFKNIDTSFNTNAASAAVRVLRLAGTEPTAKFTALQVTGALNPATDFTQIGAGGTPSPTPQDTASTPFRVPSWYPPLFVRQVTGGAITNLGRIRLSPCYTSEPITVDKLSVYVNSGVTSATLRAGIYLPLDATKNQANPGYFSLLVDGGTFDCSTSGVKTITFTTAALIPANTWFFIAAVPQGALPNLYYAASTDGFTPYGTPNANGTTGSGYQTLGGGVCLYDNNGGSGWTGALPGTLTTTLVDTSDCGVTYHRSA